MLLTYSISSSLKSSSSNSASTLIADANNSLFRVTFLSSSSGLFSILLLEVQISSSSEKPSLNLLCWKLMFPSFPF